MRYIVTGGRNWDDEGIIEDALEHEMVRYPSESIWLLMHGGGNGAAQLAASVARKLGWKVETYPAHWKLFGKSAGPKRNQLMVDQGADECFAFPMPGSVGTWDCIRRCNRVGIQVTIYPPHAPWKLWERWESREKT